MIEHHFFQYPFEFKLETGDSLPGFQLKYTTYGKLNQNHDNVIWLLHAFSGSSNFMEWWEDFFNNNELINPEEDFVICVNMPGSCYGSTGPLSVNPVTKTEYFHSFPALTNKDIVNAFDLLREDLKINQIKMVMGFSMGGQQALEWIIEKPDLFEHAILMGTNAQHSPWGIAFNECQRQAIEQDITWQLNTKKAGLQGMKNARSIAMLSYRNPQIYNERQQETNSNKLDNFKASSYQQYQGDKFSRRFNAFSYRTLSKAMDSHHVGRNRGGVVNALKKVKASVLVIGIREDLLFPVSEQQEIADHIENAELAIINSVYGHDGFLVETEKIKNIISKYYQKQKIKVKLA